jgi:hypothetical protein
VSLPALTPVDFPTLGWQIHDWWETFLRHGPGDILGEKWEPSDLPGTELDAEEILHICWCYRLRPDGRRVFKRVVRVRPKGRRKSEIAGGLCVVEALGPCRFSHWARKGEVSYWGYRYEEGEPVGMPVVNPVIRALATEEDQAGNTYDNTAEMLKGPEITAQFGKIDVGLTRAFLPGGGEIIPSTAGAASKEGGKETFFTGDEPWLWTTKKHHQLRDMVSRNLVKRKIADGWGYWTSNAHQPGRGSVLEAEYEWALGKSLDDMVREGILVDWLQSRDELIGADFHDDEKVTAALRDLYGAAESWFDFGRVIQEIRDPATNEAEARRAWLNQPTSDGSSWLPMAQWNSLRVTEPDDELAVVGEVEHRDNDANWDPYALLEIKAGEPVAVGFDGSRNNDSSALVIATEGGVVRPWKWWEKGVDDGDDWEVDSDDVTNALSDLAERHPIALMYADPYLWEDTIAGWAKTHGRKVVRERRTGSQRQMALDLHNFETAVRAGTVRHCGNAILTRHVRNTHTLELEFALDGVSGQAAHLIQKERRGSPNKMDLSMAMVLAWTARADALTDDLFTPLRRRKSKRLVAISD